MVTGGSEPISAHRSGGQITWSIFAVAMFAKPVCPRDLPIQIRGPKFIFRFSENGVCFASFSTRSNRAYTVVQQTASM
jgi:hypothetical protein